jgi:hypothetical protein
METGLDEYRDQINVWMETICEKTFGDSGSRVDPESKKKERSGVVSRLVLK